jgi:hypothetical protein
MRGQDRIYMRHGTIQKQKRLSKRVKSDVGIPMKARCSTVRICSFSAERIGGGICFNGDSSNDRPDELTTSSKLDFNSEEEMHQLRPRQ